jgi:hypothetical protein
VGRKLRRCLAAPAALFLAATAASTVWAAGPASAAAGGKHHRPPPYGPHTCTVVVDVSPGEVGHGGTISVTLSGDCLNDVFTIAVKDRTLGAVTTNDAGTGSRSFALPCAVNVGTHTVFAVDAIGNTGSAPLRVTPAPCASAPGHGKEGGPPPKHHPDRPGTGSDLRVAGVKATAAMPAGAAAVGVAGLLILTSLKRRRRRDFTR